VSSPLETGLIERELASSTEVLSTSVLDCKLDHNSVGQGCILARQVIGTPVGLNVSQNLQTSLHAVLLAATHSR